MKLTIGSKNFTEQKVLGEIYAQGLQAAGYTIDKQLNLGDEKIALKALEANEISAYPEYTGTALGSFFGVGVGQDPEEPADRVRGGQDGLREEEPDRASAHAVHELERGGADREEGQEARGHQDLRPQGQVAGSDAVRHTRVPPAAGLPPGPPAGLRPEVQEVRAGGIALRHEVLAKGQADVSIVFTTDPQVKRNNEVLLEDDKGMFPPYNSTLVVRDEAVQGGGPRPARRSTKLRRGSPTR